MAKTKTRVSKLIATGKLHQAIPSETTETERYISSMSPHSTLDGTVFELAFQAHTAARPNLDDYAGGSV